MKYPVQIKLLGLLLTLVFTETYAGRKLPVVRVAEAKVQFVSGKPAYIVAVPKTALEKRITQRLSVYLEKVLGTSPRVVSALKLVPAAMPAIVLSSDEKLSMGVKTPVNSPEAFALKTKIASSHPVIIASGNTELGLKRAVQRLIIESEQILPGLVIPDLDISQSPWIPKREWTLANWTPQFPRGVFHNPHADLRPNIYLYNDEQLAKYVEMFDCFGFSGGQFATSTHGYQVSGTKEAFRDRQLKIAKELRANGQNVTYRIWASQFDGFGWIDPEVSYTPSPGNTAFNDPKVRAVYEKQYNGFAEMAPYVDMIIAQYYDPGNLHSRADVFNYMHLLIDKFRAKKPDVKLGVMFWSVGSWKKGAEAAFMQELIDNNFSDALLLENTMPHTYAPGVREGLHEDAKRRNLNMGVWGWYTAEMETDQAPMMLVNAKLLSNFYRQMRDGADKIHPISYWSEMEAYHLNNIFTMYASGQLLWNPDREPDEILAEISDGIWGPENGAKILHAIKLIEDTRSGPTWDTYWWSLPGRRLGTENPRDDLRRADEALAALGKMRTDPKFVPKFPLPFPPSTFVELTIPHLKQIRQYAEFRIKVDEIKEAAGKGTSKAELTRLANAAWKPIPDYNTWVGIFGQAEAIRQEEIIKQLASDLDIQLTTPGWLRFRDAERLLEAIQGRQRYIKIPWKFPSEKGWLLSGSAFMWWSVEKFRDRLQLLIDAGTIEKVGEDYQLTNWQEYSLNNYSNVYSH